MATRRDYDMSLEAIATCNLEADLESLGPLEQLSIDKLHGLYRNGLSVAVVVAAHINRLGMLNNDLHAVLELNYRALDIARELDAEYAQVGRMRGPLFGVPVLIKDNIHAHEVEWECAAGSLALLGAHPRSESPAVTKLRASGAVLLGITNCSEWCNFRSFPSDDGWSARGGQTFGAYHYRQDPSGSSSGSAVAVDMGFCVAALGTETSGNVIFPSSQNNVVGLKPTVGLVSRRGVVPISPEQDTIGVLARSYTDAAYILDAISGRDKADSKTMAIPFAGSPSSNMSKLPPLIGAMRIGVPRNALEGVHPQILEAFQKKILGPLEDIGGVELVDCSFPGVDLFKSLNHLELTDYIAGEFNEALINYVFSLKTNPNHVLPWGALCDFIEQVDGEEHSEKEEVTAVNSRYEIANKTQGGRFQIWDRHTSWHAPGVGHGPRPASGETNIQLSALGDFKPKRNMRRFEQVKATTRQTPAYLRAKNNARYFAAEGGIRGALDGKDCPGGIEGINDHEPVSFLVVPTAAACANYFAAGGGYPQVTIPLGYFEQATEVEYNDTGRLVRTGPNIPYGVSVIGRHFDEGRYLSHICKQIEAVLDTRSEISQRRPAFLNG
ncbi:amidase [Ophiostoma piceae UAMH 11346]|uniref:Amidase n=1 Tax=Ophiostoma piceae (strain UAMH 11346) TaxID=1262450 RepID=S3BZD8_OPHP1|nr:amidase [Ophiostoma piceae UAMH 11346]